MTIHLNRIFLLCITASIFMLGCGGPSPTEMHELEQRISANEKNRSETESALKGITSKAEQVAGTLAQIESTESSIAQRLSAFESSLAELKKELNELDGGKTEATSVSDTSALAKLNDRIVELEKSLAAQVESVQPQRSLIAGREAANTEAPEMADGLNKGKKTSGKRNGRTKPGGFEVTLFSWNVESEGSDPELIAKQLAETNRYDVYGLCEVLPESIGLYTDALGSNYRTIASRSGYNDRLQIIYNTRKFELLQRLELDEINFERRYRSPLVAHLRDKATKQQFMVVNNHLARGRAEVRTKQAKQLVEWAREQNVPIVAVGDYNFDYVFRTRKGNDGFNAMLRDNIWQWVEPVELIDTNWYDNPREPDGKDDYPGSMLDFAFVSGPAKVWEKRCRVIVRDGDFPDNESTSDHRPFELMVTDAAEDASLPK